MAHTLQSTLNLLPGQHSFSLTFWSCTTTERNTKLAETDASFPKHWALPHFLPVVIDQYLLVRPNHVLVRLTEKVGLTSATSGKVSVEPYYWNRARSLCRYKRAPSKVMERQWFLFSGDYRLRKHTYEYYIHFCHILLIDPPKSYTLVL